MTAAAATSRSSNVAQYVGARASETPDRLALAAPRGDGFETWTCRELETRTRRVAAGLARLGLRPEERVAVFVRPGLAWAALVHGLFHLGAVPVLIDPGMGREGVLAALRRVAPRALIGVWQVHLARRLAPRSFASVELALSVGPSGPLCDGSLEALLATGADEFAPSVAPSGTSSLSTGGAVARDARDPAAILFTSGSTGPAKGVLYEHGMFAAQVELLRAAYPSLAGGVDLACFPLFALFGPALGLVTVFPKLDFTRPASCDPAAIVRAVREFGVTSSFGSPAIWRRVVPWCETRGEKLSPLADLMIAGAPVEADLVRRAAALIAPGGRVHTPYGATEALPIAEEDGARLAGPLAARAAAGEGTCVGRAVPGVEIRLIRIDDRPIERWSDGLLVAAGEPGEICVRGRNVTRAYAEEPEATRAAKIPDGESFWHRVGDLGRFDADGRLWFLGRKAHRLETAAGMLFPVPIENAFRAAAGLGRCAVVGTGPRGAEIPVLIVESPRELPRAERERRAAEILAAGASIPACRVVERVRFKAAFPLDVRHQAKIDRVALKRWAEGERP